MSAPDVLVTFLGAPRQGYRPAVYRLGEQRYESPFCPAALAHMLTPGRIVALLTPGARSSHYAGLQEAMGRYAPLMTPVDVDDTHLWGLFDALTGALVPGESVVFDVTYGYRYLPMVTLAAGQFLAETAGVRTVGIYYGAYERQVDGETLLVDLAPLLDLLRWTQTAGHFGSTGNAGRLVRQLPDAPGLPAVQRQLRELSRLLRLGLTPRVGPAVAGLRQLLQPLADPAPGPVDELLGLIDAKYAPLQLDGGEDNHPTHLLRHQARLIRWYVDNDLALQALILAREWFVSCVALAEDPAAWLEPDLRAAAVAQLHAAAAPAHPDHDAAAGALRALGLDATLPTLWRECADLRNELAHAGMRPQTRAPGAILTDLQRLAAGVERLADRLPVPPGLDQWLTLFGESGGEEI